MNRIGREQRNNYHGDMKNILKDQNSSKVWNRNFSRLIFATAIGCCGGIAASYGLSFLVYYETGSILASALIIASRLIPSFILPLVAGPFLDRFARKPVLVWGDVCNCILYLVMGFWLLFHDFSYVGYLFYSILLACAGSIDELAFNSILPMAITKGYEQKSYAVSNMIYPMLNVVMVPVAALVMQTIGIPILLILQGICAGAAALIENGVYLENDHGSGSGHFDFSAWYSDLKEALHYLKSEPGLLAFYTYSSVANAMVEPQNLVLVAFFSTTPGFTPLMYSLFSVFECAGRTGASLVQYIKAMKREHRYGFSLLVMVIYTLMDATLLLCSYPLMLFNRLICGSLGQTSGTLRMAAIQSYIPEAMRARINSLQTLMFYGTAVIFSLIFGWIGDQISFEGTFLLGAALQMVVLYFTWIRQRKSCKAIFLAEPEQE